MKTFPPLTFPFPVPASIRGTLEAQQKNAVESYIDWDIGIIGVNRFFYSAESFTVSHASHELYCVNGTLTVNCDLKGASIQADRVKINAVQSSPLKIHAEVVFWFVTQSTTTYINHPILYSFNGYNLIPITYFPSIRSAAPKGVPHATITSGKGFTKGYNPLHLLAMQAIEVAPDAVSFVASHSASVDVWLEEAMVALPPAELMSVALGHSHWSFDQEIINDLMLYRTPLEQAGAMGSIFLLPYKDLEWPAITPRFDYLLSSTSRKPF